jgi:hypothetical protein
MSRSPSDDYRMAALDTRKQLATVNLMAAGEGTPWEDRGAIGFIVAYVKTVWLSMTSPVKLTFSMRRPETSSDVTQFVLASGFMWALGIVIVAILQYVAIGHLPEDPNRSFFPQQFWTNTAIEAAAALGGTWLALKFASIAFLKIVTPDLSQPVRSVLVYNVMGYALGPSILAVIPYVGPPIAAIWILGDWITLAQARIRAKRAGAITAAILTFLGVGVGVGAVYLIASLIGSQYVLDWRSLVVIQPPPGARH